MMKSDRFTLEDVPNEMQLMRQDILDIKNILLNQSAEKTEPETQLPEKELLTVADVSQMLNLSKGTIYNKTSKQEIPCIKKGRRVYFDKKEIVAWLREDSRKTIQQLQAEADMETRK
jgi:excisionase family DNA binding protein